MVLLASPTGRSRARRLRCPRPAVSSGTAPGATGLDVLLPHEGFSLHPLMTVTDRGADLRGAGAAVDGATPRALEAARSLAAALGLRAVRVAPEDRVAYHTAASVASNLLVTLEAAAERLAASAGVDRDAPRAARPRDGGELGRPRPRAALTGPVARGDEATVARQRAAVAERAPDLVEAFDAFVAATRASRAARDARRRPSRRSHRHEDRAHRRRAARRAARPPARGSLDRPRPDHGRAARRATSRSCAPRARRCDLVVVSLFVNPAQFEDAGDLAAYPRDEARDAALAQEAGADVLFAPEPAEVYPPGFATTVAVDGPLTGSLEGAHRGAAHFAAVATVVTKLLNMAQPDVAFFGQKDAQQLVVVRRVVRDLDLPVRIEAVPTVREPDGLASRAATSTCATATASGRSRSAPPSTSPASAWGAASATRPPWPARARPSCASAASTPSTSRSSTPTLAPLEAVDGTASWPWPPASAPPA